MNINMNARVFNLDKQANIRDRILQQEIKRALDEYEDSVQNANGNLNFLGLKNIRSQRNYVIQILWSLIILACLSLCIYQIYDRIAYYLTYPVYVVINLAEYSNLTYPAITVCHYYSEALSTAMKTQVVDTNRSYCEVDMLDVLGTKSAKNARGLWKLSRPKDFITYATRTVIFSLPNINSKRINHTELYLPQGMCTEIKQRDPSFAYVGTLSAMPIVLIKKSSTQCRASEFFIYQKDLFVNPATTRRIPLGQLSGLQLKMKVYKYENTPTVPCVDISEASECHQQCYSNIIKERVPCWMPFVFGMNASQECKNISLAKLARSVTLDIYRKVNPEQDCNCLRPCKRQDFQVTLESIMPAVLGGWEMFLYFPDNFIEEITEILAYSGTKLLCDIGGNLGLYLGLSILALVDALQSIFDSLGLRRK